MGKENTENQEFKLLVELCTVYRFSYHFGCLFFQCFCTLNMCYINIVLIYLPTLKKNALIGVIINNIYVKNS